LNNNSVKNLEETKKRSLSKAMTWRIVAVIDLGIISYLITGSWQKTTLITLLFNLIQIVFYYFHERVWNRISWGKTKHPLSEIPINKNLTKEDLAIIKNNLKSLGYIE